MNRICTQLIFLFFLLVLPAGILIAEDTSSLEPELKDIIVTTSSTDLILFAAVKNSFTEQMINGVQNGIPITFTFYLKLEKLRSYWFDETLVDTSITHTMTYDSLKEEYTIARSNNNGKVKTTRSLDEAQQLMTELNSVHVVKLSELEPDAPYSLQLKAVLEKNTLPLGIHHVLPLTSLWDFETDWRAIEFRY
ncbi:MAG: hypothetical protein CSB34_06960 [Desulfobulbus propionicus]|nr:MAG: hypothetical protein CSB34_06960 [Desulfobulbus propionicus]PIE66414.1 MAG: hypothetical protein CSA26_00945 [Desulfobacterales bacterium]